MGLFEWSGWQSGEELVRGSFVGDELGAAGALELVEFLGVRYELEYYGEFLIIIGSAWRGINLLIELVLSSLRRKRWLVTFTLQMGHSCFL